MTEQIEQDTKPVGMDLTKPADRPGTVEYYDALRQAAGNLPAHQYPDGHIRAIMKMAVPADVTFSEAAGFLSICHAYRLNPILGQAFLAKGDDGKVKVLTGRDTFITLAESQSGYRGIANGVVYKGETCIIRRDPTDPYKVYIEHDQGFDGHSQADLVGAYCVVYDETRPPIIIRRFWKDYEYLWSNDRKKNWRRSGTDMIENRAIAAALRRMYSLAGLLISGEEDSLGTSAPLKNDTSSASGLREGIERMEAAQGIVVSEEWDPEVVVTEGKYEGEGMRWCDIAEKDPKYFRQVATRRWLGISAEDAKRMHAFADTLEALDGPVSDEDPSDGSSGAGAASEGAEEGSRGAGGDSEVELPSLNELHARARSAGKALVEAGSGKLDIEEAEAMEQFYRDEDRDNLWLLVETLERRAKGGAL